LITKNDILDVCVKESHILTAVLYAEKSLHYTYNRMGSGSSYNRLLNIVKGLIMEEAFKSLLDSLSVKYDLLGCTHWTKKDKYDIGINNSRCDIKGFYISNSFNQRQLLMDRSWFLDCCALVPSDQVESVNLKENDLYIFPFLIGTTVERAANELPIQKRYYFVHDFFDYQWIKNSGEPLGKLIIQLIGNRSLVLRIGGQGEDGELIIEQVILNPSSTYQTNNTFQTALFLQMEELPNEILKIMSQKNHLVHEVHPNNWGNIWFYDAKVFITGGIYKGEFREKSIEIPRFYKDCKQYTETKTINRSIPKKNLYPIDKFL